MTQKYKFNLALNAEMIGNSRLGADLGEFGRMYNKEFQKAFSGPGSGPTGLDAVVHAFSFILAYAPVSSLGWHPLCLLKLTFSIEVDNLCELFLLALALATNMAGIIDMVIIVMLLNLLPSSEEVSQMWENLQVPKALKRQFSPFLHGLWPFSLRS